MFKETIISKLSAGLNGEELSLFQAAAKLGQAADLISAHPVALQLRTLQTMSEIATEKNSTIIFPAQFMTTVKEALETIKSDNSGKS